MRPVSLALALALALPAAAQERLHDEAVAPETPIPVPSPIPTGFLVAWKPSLLSVRTNSGVGSRFGSDKLQPVRFLARYTSTLFDEKLLARGEIEGGQFSTDTQGAKDPNNVLVGSDGYDLTVHLLGGTATRIRQGFVLTASAGFLTRYQRGRAVSGAPSIGVFGVTSNMEAEIRVAPIITLSLFLEGGLTPFPYGAQTNLGDLSDASEVRARALVSLDLTPRMALELGLDFTRWHASFTNSTILSAATTDRALFIESREQALTLGLRFKPQR